MTPAAAPCGKCFTLTVRIPKIRREIKIFSMNMKTRTFTGRIALIAVALLLVLTTLVSCSSGNTKTLVAGTIDKQEGATLSVDQLRELADMLASTYSKDFDPQEMLIAASRGYDMTDSGFKDSEVKVGEEGTADKVATAIKVINAANQKASTKIQFDFGNINMADVNTLINAFKTEVDVASSGSIFDVILVAIGAALRWITNTLGFGNYLVGICIFAIVIEILMIPFAIKQQKNSIEQAKLRPKIAAIENKYRGRNDQVTQQKKNQEIQEFYQRENVKPYSGCLPLLIQLPIIIALYNIVIDPLHYVMGQASGISGALSTYLTTAKAAGGMGASFGNSSIEVLSYIKENGTAMLEGLKDFAFFKNGTAVFDSVGGAFESLPNFNIGPFNFGLVPSFERFDILLLVPVLTFVAYFFTSKLNRKFMPQPTAAAGDDRQVACSNTMMDVTMPAMSTFFTFMVPALVGVYWIFRSLLGVLKQFLMSRVMPLPVFTEEDYKRAAKEMAGKRVEVKKSANAGKVRSLHHIDDEDYEDTRERALARKAAIEERERAEQAEKAKKTPFGAAQIKDDKRADKKKKDAEVEETDAEESVENNDNQNNTQE